MAKKKTSDKKKRLRHPPPVTASSWRAEMDSSLSLTVRISNTDGSGSFARAHAVDLTAADRREYVRIVELLIEKAHERAGYG